MRHIPRLPASVSRSFVLAILAFGLSTFTPILDAGGDPAKEDGASEKPTQTKPSQAQPARRKTAQSRPAARKPTQFRPAAGKPAPSPTTPATDPERPLLFTNEDLERFHDGSSPSRVRTSAPGPEDPLKPARDREEHARWREQRIQLLQQKIQEQQVRLPLLEQKRLSILNPFVPRPSEGEEAKAEEKGLSGPELLAKVDEEIQQTRQALAAAEKDLAAFLQAHPE